MKVLGVVCSPRKGGNTEILVREALEAAREGGSETELFLIADNNIAPCDGCTSCEKTGACKIDDDMQKLYRQLESADGLILGTPVYFYTLNAQAKAIMDRTYALAVGRKLRGKVAAAIVAVGKMGAGQALSTLYQFFVAHRMLIAGGGVGFGTKKGEVRRGVGGSHSPMTALEEAQAVGRSVVRMLQGRGSK